MVKISNSYFIPKSISRPWRFVLFVLIKYTTLDGHFSKIYGHHFMLVNHFMHGVRINFPFYLMQSLDGSILSLQNDPNGDHACHEGLMDLIMNVLKMKKVERPRMNRKTLEDYDTDGSDSEDDYEEEMDEEEY